MTNHYLRFVLGISTLVFIAWYLGVHLQGQQLKGIAVAYSCDDEKTLDAIYSLGTKATPVKAGERPIPTGSVRVVLEGGRTLNLLQTISASGVRYANADESFIFWNKGHGAIVLEGGTEKNYRGCIEVAPKPPGSNLSRAYSSGANDFSVRLPDEYTTDSTYIYQMTPERNIGGVKFTIPASLADGTNLGHDTYLSIERLPGLKECSASAFFYDVSSSKSIIENSTTYSVASSTGAGAGNRYEETIYAIPGTNPCLAVRYFVHYSVFENYPAGMVKEFDKNSLLSQFDLIRRTLVVN